MNRKEFLHLLSEKLGHAWGCEKESCVCDTKNVLRNILPVIDDWINQIINAPVREGDRMPHDEIIPDGVREALVRQVQREKAGLCQIK